MAKLRPGRCHREVERAFTRHSRYRKKSYIKGIPGSRVAKYVMGSSKAQFAKRFILKSAEKEKSLIRHNALESARIAITNFMNKKVKPENYKFIIHTYPHQVLREKPIACGAGADRYSSGMQKAFGKPVGRAAIIKSNQQVFSIEVDNAYFGFAVEALKRAGKKLPIRIAIDNGKPLC
ncbi:MAG: 50S ribosomal protein L16 [Candidatus Nanoarchaeia archaeon]|nr:50S ribosomal protein L16 [Candidatus Nanoarchaeia archaeon]